MGDAKDVEKINQKGFGIGFFPFGMLPFFAKGKRTAFYFVPAKWHVSLFFPKVIKEFGFGMVLYNYRGITLYVLLLTGSSQFSAQILFYR